jgi:hypothetical protein
MGLLSGQLRAWPAAGSSIDSWAATAEPLAAMIEFGGVGGADAASSSVPARTGQADSQPQPLLLLGREDAAALQLLLQGLLHASEPERQEGAARVLAALVRRSGSAAAAAHLVQRGALRRARELAAGAAFSQVRESARLLVEQLELELELERGCQLEEEAPVVVAAGIAAAPASSGGLGEGVQSAGEATAAAASSGACAACGAAKASGGAKLRKCAGCRAVHYCGAACQTAHWRQHRAACRATQGAQ